VFVSLLSFSLFETLTEAQEGVETELLGFDKFRSNHLVGLIIDISSLRVTDKSPFDIKILQLLSTDFSGVSTCTSSTHILACNLDFIIKKGFDGSNVDADWSNDNFNF
jgi:hypothetical protein